MDENKVSETQTDDTGKDQTSQTVRTEEEKAAYNLKKKADDAKALGLNTKEILGESDDEVPAWYKKEKANEVKKTAIDLADSISDLDTKDKVKDYLQNRIVPSANAEEDFRLALGAVSASKNKQVLEELNRYSKPRVVASGSSQPTVVEDEFIPTEQELVFMRKPYNMSKEKILLARKKQQ